MTDSVLSLSHIGITLRGQDGSMTHVSDDISLEVAPREFVSIVGPSGCGKTTLLRAAAGLRPPSSGQVRFRGEELTDVVPGMAVVFQEYNKSLFPWLTIKKNVSVAARQLPTAEREQRVRNALAAVGLDEYSSRYPWELSGGMQQRTALARALVSDPAVLMMDEPFASVDALTRRNLENMVADLSERSSFAALLVTHDVGEAVYLSDRVLVLSARPSHILSEIAIDLPRPRRQDHRLLPRFTELEGRVLEQVEAAGRGSVAEGRATRSNGPNGQLGKAG